MGRAGVLERRSRVTRRAGHALVVAAVVVATLAGAFGALDSYSQARQLSIGEIELSVEPGRRGALDLDVPLVDWGVRFEDAVRLPARLNVELRTVDRLTVSASRRERRWTCRTSEPRRGRDRCLPASADRPRHRRRARLGLLVAFALATAPARACATVTAAALTALATAIALIVLLPPRGPIDTRSTTRSARTSRALEAVESAQRSTRQLDQELDAQLVGLARLVTRPAGRIARRPPAAHDRLRPAQQLPLDPDPRAGTGDGPLFFAGDLTDSGSPLEARLVRRVTDLGKPFVFVSGNHDSDSLERELARRGAIVLTKKGS